MTNMEALITDLERCSLLTFPTLKKLSCNDVITIWGSMSKHIRQELMLKKPHGVRVTGLGTFYIKKWMSFESGEVLSFRRPVFSLSKTVAQIHELKHTSVDVLGEMRKVVVSYEKICSDIPYSQKIVQSCVEETLRFFYRIIMNRQDTDFILKDIGILVIRGKEVTMTFYKDFLLSLNKSRYVVQQLLKRNLVILDKEITLSPTHSGHVYLFPQFEVMVIPGKVKQSSAEGKILEEKGSDEESENTKGHLLHKFCVLRKSLSPNRLARAETKEEAEEKTKGKEPRIGVFPPCLGSPKKKDEGKHRHRKIHPDRSLTAPPQCEDHRRAGQEMCYICMQRDERNRQASLAEERRRKELAEWRELAEQRARRERDEMWRAQVRILKEKHPEYAEMKRKAAEERRERLKSYLLHIKTHSPTSVYLRRMRYSKELLEKMKEGVEKSPEDNSSEMEESSEEEGQAHDLAALIENPESVVPLKESRDSYEFCREDPPL